MNLPQFPGMFRRFGDISMEKHRNCNPCIFRSHRSICRRNRRLSCNSIPLKSEHIPPRIGLLRMFLWKADLCRKVLCCLCMNFDSPAAGTIGHSPSSGTNSQMRSNPGSCPSHRRFLCTNSDNPPCSSPGCFGNNNRMGRLMFRTLFLKNHSCIRLCSTAGWQRRHSKVLG